MVTSDYHVPFLDMRAFEVMKKYTKQYKPDYFIINGDFMDMYSLSNFSKSPDRKKQLSGEIKVARKILDNLIKSLPKTTKIIFLEGNHEVRMQRFIWNNEALFGLEALNMESILNTKKYKNLSYIKCDLDFWSKERGSYKLGDILILHGDSRLNGASYSRHSGYSAKNTMAALQMNIIMGHTHRLGFVFASTPNGVMKGIEGGCLCHTTRFNWQQGFVTYEIERGKSHNVRLYHINKGKLVAEGKVYQSRTKKDLLKKL